MNFSELTELLVSTVRGGGDFPVIREFEDGSAYSDNIFSAVGIKEIKALDEASGCDGISRFQTCKITFNITLFGKASGSSDLIPLAEDMYLKLFSSSLNILDISGGGLSFNAKLNRLQYCFSVTLNVHISGGDAGCSRQDKIISLNGDIAFSVKSFEFERARALNEIPSVCGGVILSDTGTKPLTLKLCGNISPEKYDALISLENILTAGSVLDLSGLGLDIPPMLLKKYSVKGEKNSRFIYCEMIFTGADSAGVTSLE